MRGGRGGRGGEERGGRKDVEKRMKEGDENGEIRLYTNYKANTHCKEKFLTGSKLISYGRDSFELENTST